MLTSATTCVSAEEFLGVLPDLTDWTPVDGGLRCTRNVDSMGWWPTFTVSHTVLRAVHPELPEMLAAYSETSYPRKRVATLVAAIQHLTNPLPLPFTINSRQGYAGPIHAVSWNVQKETVTLGLLLYHMFPTAPMCPTMYPIAYPEDDATVHVDWMDTYYPGWRERYLAAETLGYTGKKLADWVCTSAESASVITLPLPGTDLV